MENKTQEFRVNPTASAIMNTCAPIVLVLGTFGNVITIVVVRRMRIQHTAMAVYLTALAFSDFTIQYTGLINEWIDYLTEFRVTFRTMNDYLCKVLQWLFASSCIVSSWLLVFMTVERVVSVWSPLKVKHICTPKRAGILVAVFVSTSLAVNSIQLFMFTVENISSGRLCCLPRGSDSKLYERELLWVSISLVALIPSLAIITGNGLILYKMQHRQQKLLPLRLAPSASGKCKSRVSSLTISLFAISLFFLVSTLPHFVFSAIYPFSLRRSKDLKEQMELRVPKVVTSLLFYTNSAMNLYLYCLSGSNFRAEVIRLLRCSSLADDSRRLAATRPSVSRFSPLSRPISVEPGNSFSGTEMTTATTKPSTF